MSAILPGICELARLGNFPPCGVIIGGRHVTEGGGRGKLKQPAGQPPINSRSNTCRSVPWAWASVFRVAGFARGALSFYIPLRKRTSWVPHTCRIGGLLCGELSITPGGGTYSERLLDFTARGYLPIPRPKPQYAPERWGCEFRGGAAEPPPRDSSRARAAEILGASRV